MVAYICAISLQRTPGVLQELIELSLSAPGRVTLPRAPPHTLLLSGSLFSPFPTGWGLETPLVAKWTGDRLRMRDAAQAELQEFRQQVIGCCELRVGLLRSTQHKGHAKQASSCTATVLQDAVLHSTKNSCHRMLRQSACEDNSRILWF
jgi:hypothetical protein